MVVVLAYLDTLHASLESADRVALGDDHASTLTTERLDATLADLTVTAHDGDLAREHDVGGAHDRVDQRVTATVDVVELALGDAVVDVDRREQQLTVLHHVVQALHTGGGLLRHTLYTHKHSW